MMRGLDLADFHSMFDHCAKTPDMLMCLCMVAAPGQLVVDDWTACACSC